MKESDPASQSLELNRFREMSEEVKGVEADGMRAGGLDDR
jgi:hypothetical protein